MRDLKALLLVVVFLIADMSSMASAITPEMAEESYAEDRLPDREGRYAVEEYGWWLAYGPDANFDGMDDRLELVIAGEESQSTTAIIGADGRKTVAIIVDYAWHPTSIEVEALTALLTSHGWESEGSWFQVMDSIDSIVLDHVPVSSLNAIHSLEGVVVVEMQNVMAPTLEHATPAARISPSDVYTATPHDRGYDGDGIVIAVLDSGVDNEHRSLNDFDDQNDAPDLDPNSYDDQKWVAGFDATSQASNPDGSQDPDDGQGHGTHVAGIALGTGDSSRVHVGGAPGSYLVDIKVLTDSGGTNSQNSINGIQWMINNRDTNWGDGAKGIQIGQMSFGSVGSVGDNPLTNNGDNGTGAEARLVNNATENGIACIVAAGNDGRQRISSPGSADGAITIGSADDGDTINRTNDFIASYSNSGPRLDDGDNDEWDELKPDIVAYGSGIFSASAATGTSLPGTPRPTADNSYESKDGTSMAAPLVSGVVAIMLQADPGLDPYEIKDILRNSSEQRGSASEPSVSDRWNDEWGFGLLDASCALDFTLERPCTPLDSGGGGVIIDPPPGNDTEQGVQITGLDNGTWFIVDDIVRIQGGVIADTGPWNQVDVKITQHLDGFEEVVLMDWTTAGGSVESWYLDVLIKEDWVDEDENYVIVEARAVGDGDLLSSDARWGNLGKMMVSFGSPSSGSTLSGTVSFSGIAQGVEPQKLVYRVDSGEWKDAHSFDDTDNSAQDWSFTWDSTEVDDGSHKISVKLINVSGVESELVRRTFNIDNLPAAPELRFQGSVTIMDQDLPADNAVAGTILEVHFNVVNTGDADATDLHLRLDAPGSESSTYPSEGKIPRLETGETLAVILWWYATEAGVHDVTIEIDPNGVQNDDESDNLYTFEFEITERPVEPTLRFLTSAVSTSLSIPSPSTDDKPKPYTIDVRIDNIGQTDATNIKATLYTWEGTGWVTGSTDSQTLSIIPGSSSSSGKAVARFSHEYDQVGAVSHRVVLEGNGVESEYSELRFTVIVDEFETGSKTSLTLSDGEAVLGFVGLPDGGLLFTTKDGDLHARTLTPKFGMPGDTLIEDEWAGEFAFVAREDGRAHIAWTKRFNDGQGYTMSDLSMASIGVQGDMSTPSSHLSPLKQSEGSYWGLDLSEKDGEVVLAGYHRDILTGGSWNDVTNIFILQNEDATSSSSWITRMNVLNDVDIKPQNGDSLAVAIGDGQIHILYQSMRNDVSGIDRVGLFYTHGTIGQTPFTFQAPAGDYASMPEMVALVEDDEEVLVAAWIEGSGRSAEVITVVQNSIWSIDERGNVSSPGATKVVMMHTDTGDLKIYHDEIGVNGPVTRYGLYLSGGDEVLLSNQISDGHVVGAGSIGQDSVVVMVSPSGQLSARLLAFIYPDSGDDSDSGFLDSILEPLPGDSREQKMMVLAGMGGGMLILLFTVVTVLRRSHREEEELEVSVEDGDLELLIETEEDALLESESEESSEITVTVSASGEIVEEVDDAELETNLEEEIEAKIEAGTASKRIERRMKRKEEREAKEAMDELMANLPPIIPPDQLPSLGDLPPIPPPGELPLPPPPAPDELPLPPPPAPGELPLPPAPERNVKCGACGAEITVKDMVIRSMDCPICSEKITL